MGLPRLCSAQASHPKSFPKKIPEQSRSGIHFNVKGWKTGFEPATSGTTIFLKSILKDKLLIFIRLTFLLTPHFMAYILGYMSVLSDVLDNNFEVIKNKNVYTHLENFIQ